ncbi:hypothetical protein ACFSAG_07405 [Sphingorhabdus buctiana]|uniref:ApeA N-terminal domain-containing protein n=1 Tax=Sphingorhabdus buctiana TaxID=1508805 RepID=A0ABW4MCJ3_9SPHN
MALDYDVDLKVSLETDTKHQSLYKWCLKETNENGDQVGVDLIPFFWSSYFHSTHLEIHSFVSSKANFSFDGSKLNEIEAHNFTKKDLIFARLASGNYRDDDWRAPPSISMIGSTRKVENISLRINRTPDGAQESCTVWGSLAYDSEVDFRNEKTEDTIEISLYLENDNFDSLFDLIRSSQIDRLSLSLSQVQGFYSEWSPSISTRRIKVLANLSDHGIEVDDEWKERIPSLGRVGEVSIAVERTYSAKLSPALVDGDEDDWLSESDDSDLESAIKKQSRSDGELRDKFLERSLSRISKLLGILIVIEVVRAFF